MMSVPVQERQIRTFQDIIRALHEEPSLREQLRVLLLSEELLRLPEQVARLTAAVSRLEQQVARLTEDVTRLGEQVASLAAAQQRTEQRLEELAAAQQRTEQRLEELAAAQQATEGRLQRLEGIVADLVRAQQATERRLRRLEADVGELRGESLERRYRERAASCFQHVLRRIRLIDHQQPGFLLDDALDRGDISPAERAEVLQADVVVHGVQDGQEVYLVARVSGTITAGDVERAVRRAALLEKATGQRALAAVAGKRLSRAAQEHAAPGTVWTVLDGRSTPPAA